MDRTNDILVWCLVAVGVRIVFLSPLAGVAVVTCALSYSCLRSLVEAKDLRRARETVDGLKHVVNENAQRLEQTMMDLQKLQNDFAFSQNARQMGLK